jgi:hypothetical protein
MEESEDQIMRDFRKSMGEMKRKWKIEECFHPLKHECVLPIKQAHSIQRNGRLSLIEEEVNRQNVLYSSISFKTSPKNFITDFVPVGKKEASTFYGFCEKHDTEVFSPIENFEFDGSDKHCFLHTYRSFAHSYHSKKQELRLYQSDWSTTKDVPVQIKNFQILGAEIALAEMEPEKKFLDNILINNEFDKLNYTVFETGVFYPFGCSSIVNPHYTVKDEPIDDWFDETKPWTSITLTVVPDKFNSFAIIATSSNSENGLKFLDHFDQLDDQKALHAISSMMTKLAENTFWSPKLWSGMSAQAKQIMINDAQFMAITDTWSKFPWSSLNLFQERFTAAKLGINK